MVRGVLANELIERGYDVLEAATTAQAESLLEAHRVDLLITDVCLPGERNGWDLVAGARGQRPDLPTILVTGYSDAPARDLPNTKLLLKPFRPSRLLDLVAEMTRSPNIR